MIYRLIAKNLAGIYHYIREYYSDQYDGETELLLLTAYLGSVAYLKKKQITVHEIIDISARSSDGVLRGRIEEKQYVEKRLTTAEGDEDRLLTFVMNMILLLRNADMRSMSNEKNMERIYNKKDTIRKIAHGNYKTARSLAKLVDNVLPRIDMKEMRKLVRKYRSEPGGK